MKLLIGVSICLFLCAAVFADYITLGCGKVFYSTTMYPDHQNNQCYIKITMSKPKPREK